MSNTEIQFTEKETVFLNRYVGTYATPKKLNRSGMIVPKEFIEAIEDGKVTSKDIKTIANLVPVFTYKSCLTIHGNLGEIQIQHIGGYKNIIQNGNGSIEVKYNAIDYQEKRELSKMLPSFTWNRNSTQDYFSHTVITEDRAKAIETLTALKNKWETKTIDGMKAKFFVSGMNYFGRYYITLGIVPYLIESDTIEIAMNIREVSKETIQAEMITIREREEKRNAEYKASQDMAEIRKLAQAEAKGNILATLASLRTATPTEGNLYVTIAQTTNGYVYKFLKVKKGSFGRVTAEATLCPTLDPKGEFTPVMKGKQLKTNEISIHPIFLYK